MSVGTPLTAKGITHILKRAVLWLMVNERLIKNKGEKS